jgi:hypothetical protein
VLIIACSIGAAPDAEPSDPDALVIATVADNRDAARLAAVLGLLGAFLFAVFIARLHGVLRSQSTRHSWISAMSLIGGTVLIGAAVVDVGLAYAASEFRAGGADLARFFVLWSWTSANVYAPGFAALIAGGTGSRAPGGVFPRWFPAFSWVLLAITGFMLLVAQAPGLGAGPGVLWIGAASVILTLRSGGDGAPPGCPQTSGKDAK